MPQFKYAGKSTQGGPQKGVIEAASAQAAAQTLLSQNIVPLTIVDLPAYLNEDMMEALREDDTQGFVDATKANKDFVPLSHMALDYAAQGKTSLDEVFKVAEFVPEVMNH